MNKDLVEKYFKNEATASEVKKVLRWFKTEEGQQFLSNRLDEDFSRIADQKQVFIKPLDTQKILTNIFNDTPGTRHTRSNRWKYVGSIAASLILISVVALYWYASHTKVVYTTAYGEKREITLPDNSKVVLNGNSSLTISKTWDNLSKREVWLEGEAFFNVVHTSNHNDFIVYTSDHLNAQVLGTKFNVLTRDQTTQVVLEEGKVRLNFSEKGKESNLTMKPGELVEFNQESSFLIRKKVQPRTHTSWKEDKMILEQTSVKELAELLKNTYGITLIVDDPAILEEKISGTVPNQNLELFLHGLAEILDVKLVREENLIHLNRSNSQ